MFKFETSSVFFLSTVTMQKFSTRIECNRHVTTLSTLPSSFLKKKHQNFIIEQTQFENKARQARQGRKTVDAGQI